MRNIQQLDADAPILQRTVELYKEFYGCLKLFPKQDQYLLGRRCEDILLNFIEYILVAVSLSKDRKLKFLEIASGKLDTLKILFRIARELKILENKKYLSLEIKILEIGRMLGGWMKFITTKTP